MFWLSQIWVVVMTVPIALAVVYNKCVYEAWKYQIRLTHLMVSIDRQADVYHQIQEYE